MGKHNQHFMEYLSHLASIARDPNTSLAKTAEIYRYIAKYFSVQ